MEFQSHASLFKPNDCCLKVSILGAGSTGSFTALTLAKMGIKDITVYDFDEIEGQNIPNQFYRESDVGNLKVDALKSIIKDFTGTDIKTVSQKIDENTDFNEDFNTIFINCFDNMEGRQLVYDKIKENGLSRLIDTRFGSDGYSIHFVDFQDEDTVTKYEEELNVETKDTPCGEKALIFTILNLSSEVCNIFKKINDESEVKKIVRRQMNNYIIING